MENENVIVNSDINENDMNILNTEERLSNFKISCNYDNSEQIRVCEDQNEVETKSNTYNKELKTTNSACNSEESSTMEQNIIVENSLDLIEANNITQQNNIVENPSESDNEDSLKISQDIFSIDTEKNSELQQKGVVENTSDSDDEENLHRNAKVKKKKRAVIVDSDSEEDNILTTTSVEENLDVPDENVNIGKKIHKRFTMEDSDSDIENEVITPHNKSFLDEMKCSTAEVIPSDSLEKKIPKRSSLYDSESSEEDFNDLQENDDYNEDHQSIKPVAYKKKSKKKNEEDKPKKMSNKEAAELRKEIKSESQRMIRETNIALPYHKPKSHTLKEFLARRPKLASAVPLNVNTPPSVAIKMSTEQLKVMSKNLKEREKEVKKFYESEEEVDDEEDKDYVPPGEEKNKEYSQLEEINNVKTNSSLELLPCKNSNKINIIDIQIIPAQKAVSEENSSAIVGDINGEKGTVDTDNDTEQLMMSMEQEQMQGAAVDSDSCENINNAISINKNEDKVTNVVVEESILYTESSKDPNESRIEDIGSEPTQNLEEEVSMNYHFNLDDIEENSEKQIFEEAATEKPRSKFEYADLEREIENFGNTNNAESSAVLKKSNLKLVRERLANIKPRLSGGPDEIIDLENKVIRPNAVMQLMERFLHHTAKKQVHKDKVRLSIVSVESGEIHKETVAMNVDEEEEPSTIEEKPGAKLQKLRDELQNQMAQKRAEFWQKKATENSNNEKSEDEVEEKEGYEEGDDFLDDEDEEAEMTESSEEEELEMDKEELEDEVIKPKSDFLDEEAEESDAEDEAVEADNEEDADNEDGSSVASSVNEEAERQSVKRPLRRIVKGFVDDSDDDEQDCDLTICESVLEKDLGFGKSQDDDFIPPAQPQSSQTPVKQVAQSRSEFEFLTPISYMTGLQNLNNSLSKPAKTFPFSSIAAPSPLKDDSWRDDLQKKLFADSEITDSQLAAISVSPEMLPETQEAKEAADTSNEEETQLNEVDALNEQELGNICSGKFSLTAASEEENRASQVIVTNEVLPSTQDLLDICSGKFTGFTNQIEPEKPKTECKNKVDVYTFSGNSEIKSLDEDQDLIISQLINEEEMETFKRKFDSPLVSNTQKRIVEEFEEAVAGGGILDSDEDDETLEVKKRKNQRRLMFSDESSADEEEKEEVIDLHDVDDEDEVEVDADNIGYDSEENEIELTEEIAVGGRPKTSEFFENEAELSESEWGSADEDEQDLDAMEFEQGDAEKFDEKKMKSDLERIHMRRLLDDDTREVKLLQELLLEDGELHGTGRERQFRWKNIDSVRDGEGEERKEEDEVYLDEEESEEQWRKRRHEREMFLMEKQKKSQGLEDDDLLSESQLLKIGHKVVQRSQSNSQNATPVEKERAPSPVIKHFSIMSNKRGSFLSRGDQVLQRLAEYNKVNAVVVGAAKNSRNFLFQSVSMEETTIVGKDKKRKATDGTPNAIKKLRLSSNLSPAIKKKDLSARAKLFGNW